MKSKKERAINKRKMEVYIHAAVSHQAGFAAWCYVVFEGEQVIAECRCGSMTKVHRTAELEAVTEAVEMAVQEGATSVMVTGASIFVATAFRKWARGWGNDGWTNSSGEDVPNPNLWYRIMSHKDKVSFSQKVRHRGLDRARAYVQAVNEEQQMTRSLCSRNRRIIPISRKEPV